MHSLKPTGDYGSGTSAGQLVRYNLLAVFYI